jgi:signal transduction histidine kinase
MEMRVSARDILLQAFPGIPEKEADDTLATGKICMYPPNTVLCREGARETTFYIILEGKVRVTKVFNEKEERVMKYLGTGDFFGEMAIIQNAPRAATVMTTEETTVLEIYKEAFSRLVERSSSVSMAMVREVSRRLTQNDEMAIEDLRMKARELAQAYQQLAEIEYARSQFLTTIAHELRTPLMTVNGFVQIARTGMLQGDGLNSALDVMARHLEDITNLVNDILFLQEMALILPEFQQVDVGGVAASAVERQREKAAQNKVGIQMNIAANIPRIPADAKSLERAIVAILDNAIKFSPDGGDAMVEVGCDVSRIWVKIVDHGVGIPESALPRIFDRFFHLDEVNGYLFRGAGIGLSIARQVIEQHRGTIEVQSKLGEGSTFIVWLPSR